MAHLAGPWRPEERSAGRDATRDRGSVSHRALARPPGRRGLRCQQHRVGAVLVRDSQTPSSLQHGSRWQSDTLKRTMWAPWDLGHCEQLGRGSWGAGSEYRERGSPAPVLTWPPEQSQLDSYSPFVPSRAGGRGADQTTETTGVPREVASWVQPHSFLPDR